MQFERLCGRRICLYHRLSFCSEGNRVDVNTKKPKQKHSSAAVFRNKVGEGGIQGEMGRRQYNYSYCKKELINNHGTQICVFYSWAIYENEQDGVENCWFR